MKLMNKLLGKLCPQVSSPHPGHRLLAPNSMCRYYTLQEKYPILTVRKWVVMRKKLLVVL